MELFSLLNSIKSLDIIQLMLYYNADDKYGLSRGVCPYPAKWECLKMGCFTI